MAVSILFSGGTDLRFLGKLHEAVDMDSPGPDFGYPESYYQKIENPWLDLTKHYDARSHDAKLNLRLTVPVALHYLGVRSRWSLPILTVFSICAILVLSCLICFRVTHDRVTSLFLTLGVASTYVGSFAVISYYDAIALAQLTLALLPGIKSWFRALLVFTASFTDERALVASAFLLLPDLCLGEAGNKTFLHRLTKPGFLAVVGGMIGCCLGRILLLKFAGLSTPTDAVTFDLFLKQIKYLHAGIWYALEGGWLLATLAAFVLWNRREWLALALMLCVTTVLLMGAFMVADVTRSACYLFPLLLVALMMIAEGASIRTLRIVCGVAFIVSLAGGNYMVYGNRMIWCQPLVVTIFYLLCQLVQLRFF